MKKVTAIKPLTAIIILLVVIAGLISYGLGCVDSALHGHRIYSVEAEGHTYKVIMYGVSISAVHDPNCSCQSK